MSGYPIPREEWVPSCCPRCQWKGHLRDGDGDECPECGEQTEVMDQPPWEPGEED
jgi:hypothetical protein